MATQLVNKGKTPAQRKMKKEAFKMWEDKDGFVTVGQLRKLLPKWGWVSSSAEVDKLIQDGDLLRFSNKLIEKTHKVPPLKLDRAEKVDLQKLIDWIAPK